MSSPQEHYDAARRYQEYFDSALRKVGMRAPQPTLGETVNDYRRKVLVQAKKTFLPRTHELRQFSLDDVRPDALKVIEPQILDACVVEASNPANVPASELRKINGLTNLEKCERSTSSARNILCDK